MGDTDTAAFWRTGSIDSNEVAGAFSRVFEGIFLKADTKVITDYVSMGWGGTEVVVAVDGHDDQWEGYITVSGVGTVEGPCPVNDFDEVVNWLAIARHLWDTELRPVAADWHDEGGRVTAIGGDFGAVAEQWAYRTTRIPLTVYYDEPHGWCVGFGRSPREATVGRVHGPFKEMNHAKLYAEAWCELDAEWKFQTGKPEGDLYGTQGALMMGVQCKRVEGGWAAGTGEPCESPLDALLMCEQRIRDREAATQIGDPAVAF